MIVIDEYLALRVVSGDWPIDLPRRLSALPTDDLAVLRFPHPEVLHVLDPRPLLDEAAAIAARYGGTGLLVAECLAAGLTYGRALYFGMERNVGRLLARAADEMGIVVRALG